SGSASTVTSSGTSALASVAFCSARSPSFAASGETAVSRRTWRTVSMRASGASGGVSDGLRRRQFAIAQWGDQAQRMRDIACLPGIGRGGLQDPRAGPPAAAALQFDPQAGVAEAVFAR